MAPIGHSELVELYNRIITYLGTSEANDHMRAFFDLVQYNGFDVLSFISHLMEKGGNSFDTDVVRMIILFLARGNKMDTIINKSSKEAQVQLKQLKTKYAIQSGIRIDGRPPAAPNAVTLARICAAFPHITCTILKNLSIERPYPTSALAALGLNIPFALRTSVAFSIMPSTESMMSLRMIMAKTILIFQYLEGTIVNAKNKKEPNVGIAEISVYASAAYKSPVLTAEDRARVCTELGITARGLSTTESYWTKHNPLTQEDLNNAFPSLN